MKKIVLLVMIIPNFYFSQIKTELEVFGNSRGSVFDASNQLFKSYNGIDGSPYIDEFFHPITIEGYSKNLPSVRYNAYEDEMEFKVNNDIQFVTKQNNLRMKFVDNRIIYFLTKYQYDNKDINGYLVELIGNGKYKLYKKEKIQVVEYNNNTTNTYLKGKNPYFEREKDVYLINDNGVYKKVPKNTKDLIYLLNLSNDESKILEFAKQKKINLKNENDQIQIINFINGL
ncbi:hypothetical protein GCM10010992_09840 [Cloacibacterium rupense]|uniref:Uncharacterized protein n=1 Tax=Cloacibacterium rupense TaxID=517423 RepID=A0ABQ2NGW3_9FLAO|nr:hypothetical protein [Cloacibacterium rupense]GGP03038.1 hypothetical protein GCM10010992_09840 [Cloacibacterium rupense]